VDIWIKVDTGNRRTGLDWEDSQNALNLAADIKKFPVYNFKGILTHAGQTYQQRGSEAICQEYSKSNQHMLALKQEFERAGFSGLEISVGDTPGCKVCPELGPVDEIRPGNFIFFDSAQLQIGSCQWQDIAVALACPVVALHPERSEAVVYGGAIHLSKDFLEVGELRSYGLVCLPQGKRWGAPIKGAYVRGLSQEHGMLKLPQDTLRKLKIGNLICILPVHSCLTVQVMGCYTTLDGKTIETIPR
jgi:D-serine deaminase-like pyridoxal phosphate-dependent protein